jgi:outer membrane murein-binding lipoprotein Lpp
VTALDLRTLEQSGDPNKIETAQLASAVQTLNSEVRSLREERRAPKNIVEVDKKMANMRRELDQSYESQIALAEVIRDMYDQKNVTSGDIEKVIQLATTSRVQDVLRRVAEEMPPF